MEETRTTGNAGTAGVHSHLGAQPSKGDGLSGKFEPATGSPAQGGGGMMDDAAERAGGAAHQARDRVADMTDQAREQVGNVAGQVRDRLGDVRDRAEEVAGQARNRISGMMEQAEDSQPIRMAQDNPLPALGIAFALGFLLAGSSDTGGRLGKAKQQVKGAVMGGISAALAQELRNVVGMQGGQGGAGGLLSSLLGNQGNQGGSDQGSRQGAGTGSSQF